MKGIGVVKCVFSRRKSDGSLLSSVSSDCARSAKEIALAYGWRGEIEVAIKGLQGRLGLGTYCQRYVEGAVHHLHLSLLAHLLLAVSDLLRSGTAANTTCAAPQCPSISQLQDRLRVRVWRGLRDKAPRQTLGTPRHPSFVPCPEGLMIRARCVITPWPCAYGPGSPGSTTPEDYYLARQEM